MRDSLEKWYGLDTPLEVINFNIGMIFFFISYVLCLSASLYLHLGRSYYYVTGLGIMLLTFFIGYAAQSGKYQLSSFAIVVLFELLIFPASYIIDGRFISFSLMYYFLGFLLTVFVQEGRLRTISYILFWVSWISSVIFSYFRLSENDFISFENVNMALDVAVPLTVCALFACSCTTASLRFYTRESEKAEESRRVADDNERSKDVFLMNMSHEIRTPMNAIMSAGEIMLAKDISDDTRMNVHHISNACRALITTLDDLLVFSDDGERNIVMQEDEYETGEFLDDIINMISVRLMGMDVKFYVYIDPYIPKKLIGDMIRLRQVFINILNNAVKYTRQGHITLRVVMSDVTQEGMVLHADVTDTGIGIKEEKLPTLFDDFTRVDDDINESLKKEGSGLGLSITKSIVNACGGSIGVKSVYNKGSVFSFDIPQKIADPEPLAKIRDSRDLGVIICDDDVNMKSVLKDTLRAMKIRCTVVENSDEMNAVIKEGIYTHLFITPECLEGSCDLPSLMGTNITIVMMKEVDDPDDDSGDARLVKPLSSLNIVKYFESGHRVPEETAKEAEPEERKVIVSGAKALVVEDNMTNLMVAERLLNRMGFEVSTASNGSSALSIAKVMSFDILFIDYMMTGMNGIDTLRAVRKMSSEWAKTVPCIVLTADAHEGAKQMLINAGFDDYLAKPIDMHELEYMVTRYLPGEKLIV